jgi:hypothetical protein
VARKTLLLVDSGADAMEVLAARLRRMDYLVVRAKTTEEAHGLLVDPRYAIGAVVIPPDLPSADLAGAVAALRRLSGDLSLPFLVSGWRPFSERRRELARAGVSHALWEPVDAHTLRFQVNRALAGTVSRRSLRRALRAPATWFVEVRTGRRQRAARVYTVSARGAFLATATPAPGRSPVAFELPLPMGTARVAGRVVATNVAGNLRRRSLPIGMAVVFEETAAETEAFLQLYAEERLRQLDV